MGRWNIVPWHWLTLSYTDTAPGCWWHSHYHSTPFFSPLPFFQQKGSSKRGWNSPAQQTAHFREDKAGEMELRAYAELRKGLVRICGIRTARGLPVVSLGWSRCLGFCSQLIMGEKLLYCKASLICGMSIQTGHVCSWQNCPLTFPVMWCYMRDKEQVQTPHNPINPWMRTFGGLLATLRTEFFGSGRIRGQDRSCFSFFP